MTYVQHGAAERDLYQRQLDEIAALTRERGHLVHAEDPMNAAPDAYHAREIQAQYSSR